MRTDPQHEMPADPRRRRRATRVVLGAGVAAALVGSGIYIATANAAETPAPPLQAEAFAAQHGAQTEGTTDAGGGKDVGWLGNGDWLEYQGVKIGGSALTARIASQNTDGGSVELHLGTATGTLLATFPVKSTGGWQKWTTVKATASSVPSGAQTVFAVMKTKSHSDFVNLNWFTLGGTVTVPTGPASSTPTSASTSAPASTPASAPASAPAAGWVDVDQAAWQKELATFDAVPTVAVPAGVTKVPEFHVDCTVSGQAPDDPIVLPGLPGASHLHTFFGAKVTANTVPADLLNEPTTCSNEGDHSAYWVPTLEKNGTPVPMKSFRVYYGNGNVSDYQDIKPFPAGLQMVVRDAKLQVATPKSYSPQFWCAGSAETGRSADGNWPVCAPGGNLIFQLGFKSCWDGKHIDSPDHKSHMGDPVNGKCTGAYPVALPNISLMVNYDSLGGDGLTLSSGMASSMHGDFMMGWTPDEISKMTKVCITEGYKCGDKPTFVGG